MAVAILATCGGQDSSSLRFRDLAQAALSRFAKGLHAVDTASILHHEFFSNLLEIRVFTLAWVRLRKYEIL